MRNESQLREGFLLYAIMDFLDWASRMRAFRALSSYAVDSFEEGISKQWVANRVLLESFILCDAPRSFPLDFGLIHSIVSPRALHVDDLRMESIAVLAPSCSIASLSRESHSHENCVDGSSNPMRSLVRSTQDGCANSRSRFKGCFLKVVSSHNRDLPGPSGYSSGVQCSRLKCFGMSRVTGLQDSSIVGFENILSFVNGRSTCCIIKGASISTRDVFLKIISELFAVTAELTDRREAAINAHTYVCSKSTSLFSVEKAIVRKLWSTSSWPIRSDLINDILRNSSPPSGYLCLEVKLSHQFSYPYVGSHENTFFIALEPQDDAIRKKFSIDLYMFSRYLAFMRRGRLPMRTCGPALTKCLYSPSFESLHVIAAVESKSETSLKESIMGLRFAQLCENILQKPVRRTSR